MSGARAGCGVALAGIVIAWLLFASDSLPDAVQDARLLVAVGDVTERTAVLWTRAAWPVTVELHGEGERAARTVVLEPVAARDHTARARLDGLTPATRYRYQARVPGAELDGEFVTAPPAAAAVPFTLIWSADVGARGFCRRAGADLRIFREMATRLPDRFLFLGDTIYADHRCRGDGVLPGGDFVARTLAGFHAKHRYNRSDPAVRAFLALTSVSATWDDHDVRSNFAGTTEPLMPVGRQAFRDYWPVDVPADDPTRLYRRLPHGRLAELFLLDTRQYRSSNCRPDGPGKTMLGSRQREWLVQALTASSAVWKLVASAVPLSIPKAWPCGDSWARRNLLLLSTGFAHERDVLLRTLRDRGVTNVVFLAADVHFASAMTHEPWPGFVVHELVAGPLAARPKDARGPEAGLGSRVRFSADARLTFGELDVRPEALTIRIFDGDGRLLWTGRLALR